MESRVCLFQIGSIFHLQTSCITLPANWLNGPMWLGALYVWRIHSSAFFRQRHFGCQSQNMQMQYSVFHSCQYGGVRKKKTMLAFNSEVFMQCRPNAKAKTASTNMQLGVWIRSLPAVKKLHFRWALRR